MCVLTRFQIVTTFLFWLMGSLFIIFGLVALPNTWDKKTATVLMVNNCDIQLYYREDNVTVYVETHKCIKIKPGDKMELCYFASDPYTIVDCSSKIHVIPILLVFGSVSLCMSIGTLIVMGLFSRMEDSRLQTPEYRPELPVTLREPLPIATVSIDENSSIVIGMTNKKNVVIQNPS